MTVLSMPVLPDCARCPAAPVVLEVDEDRGALEVCVACGLAQRPMPVLAGIRDAVRESRRRRLLGPSCLGRLHSRCTAQLCECTCGHPGRDGRRAAP